MFTMLLAAALRPSNSKITFVDIADDFIYTNIMILGRIQGINHPLKETCDLAGANMQSVPCQSGLSMDDG